MQIEDFISPSILQRLSLEAALFRAKITDWRSMVDCVLVDTNYDGNVFNVVFSDVPQKKDALVRGSYSLPLPDSSPCGDRTIRTVAVKIIDMLGEEVLAIQQLADS